MLTDRDMIQLAHEAPRLMWLLDYAQRRDIAFDVPSRTSLEGHGGVVDMPHIVLINASPTLPILAELGSVPVMRAVSSKQLVFSAND
jgi:hypothetical protein